MKSATLTEKMIKSRKWPVLTAAAAAAAADIFAVAVLGVGGFAPLYFIMPCLLLTFDIALIALAALTNFRFRYSAGVAAGYALAAIILSVLGITVCGDSGSGSAITTAATALWMVMHLASAAVIILTSLYAAKLKGFNAVFAVICVAVIVCAAAVYSAFLFDRGFFGQQFGDQNRTLAYTYHSATDSYEVKSALEGKGENVVIPQTFNGKKVSAVSAGLFTQEGVENVYIQADADITVEDVGLLNNYTGSLPLLYVDKGEIDVFRTNFYAAANEENSDKLFSVAANILPCNLDEGEVYVTFKYDRESYGIVEGEILPTWFGRSGEIFDISEYEEDFPYMLHSDKNSADDLYWCDVNFGGYIFSGPVNDYGAAMTDMRITEGMSLQASFERVYRVYIGEDNDEVYETALTYKNTELEGQTLEYRYAVPSTADELLESIPAREGLSVEGWNYTWYEGGTQLNMRTPFSQLLGSASTSSNEIYVFPQWKVNDSVITITGGTSFTYGDEVVLGADVTAPAEGFGLAYDWQGAAITSAESGQSVDLGFLAPFNSGNYTVTVTASAPEITSLQGETTAAVYVNVAKKPVDFEWTLPSEYTGFSQTAICAPEEGAEVDGNEIQYAMSGAAVRNAGNYTASVYLTSDSGDYYSISAATASVNFTVARAEVSAQWDSTLSFVYNGSAQYPAVTIQGIGEDGALEYTLSGNPVNAGQYTVRATLASGNYILTNPTAQVTITARPITVNWREGVSYSYNGSVQNPTVQSINGEVTGEETSIIRSLSYSIISGGGVNAGEHTVEVTLPEGNYVFSDAQTYTYEISKRTVATTYWDTNSFVYNGREQHPAVTQIPGALNDEDEQMLLGSLVYGGGQVNAGSGYTVTVTLDAENYELNAAYDTYSFSISRRGVTLVWQEECNFIYDGTDKGLSVLRAENLAEGDDMSDLHLYTGVAEGTAVNAGNYTMTARLGSDNVNYMIAGGGSALFIIERRGVTLVWQEERTFTYDGNEKSITVVSAENLASGEELADLNISCLNNSASDAGEYTASAVLGSDNYTITSGASASFTIEKRGVTLVWQEERTFTYDGTRNSIVVESAENLAEGDSLNSLDLTYRVNGGASDAGDYVTTAILGNDNYTITSGESAAFTIAKREVTLVWDGETSFEYSGEAQYPKVESVNNLASADDMDDLDITYGGFGADAGHYTVTASIGSANYTAIGAECEYDITAKTVTVTWRGEEFIESGEPQAPSAEVSDEGAEAFIVYTYYNKEGQALEGMPSAAGEYYVTASSASDNYAVDAGSARKDFTIAAAQEEEQA